MTSAKRARLGRGFSLAFGFGDVANGVAEVAERFGIIAVADEQQLGASRNTCVTFGMAASRSRYSARLASRKRS
jgi:hypothetical protein